jgi:hypothetical protein
LPAQRCADFPPRVTASAPCVRALSCQVLGSLADACPCLSSELCQNPIVCVSLRREIGSCLCAQILPPRDLLRGESLRRDLSLARRRP